MPATAADRRAVPLDRFLPSALGVFALAFGVRLIHLLQIQDAPWFALRMSDAQSYHVWAQRIAGGEWIGNDVFYQAPLYPYVLGAIYATLGDGPMVVRLVQIVLGALACVFLTYAGWRLGSRRAGLLAGTMLALYAPAIFFDGLIQKSVLDGFLLCLALAVLSGLTVDPGRRWPWWVAGLTLGGLVLSRENAVVFALAALGWLLWTGRRAAVPRLALAGCLAGGVATVLVPVAARNLAVSGELHLTTAQLGPNLYIGNNPDATGVYQPLRFGRGDPRYERQDATELAEAATGRTLTPAQVSRYWTGRVLTYIRTQPGDWLQLMGRKVRLAWNAAEVADTEDQLSYADRSLVLRVTGAVWHFGVLAPLALFGMWATRSRRGELMLLYWMLAAYTAALVAFAVMARYRYPLVPLLILFAAAGLAGVTRPRVLSRPPRRLAAGAGIAAAAALFCNWPMYSMADMRAVTDSNVGTELQTRGDVNGAIARYRDALARNPNDAVALSNLGTALAEAGQLDDAVAAYRRGLALAPDDADGHYNLANALAARDRWPAAVAAFREALRLEPAFADAHINLGTALANLGRLDEAAAHFRQGASLKPDAAEPFANLGLVAAARGELADAIGYYRQALANDPDFADAHTNLGAALQQAGRPGEALRHLRRAAALRPGSADAHNNLGAALAAGGALDDAAVHFRQAVAVDPTFAEAHGNLGMALQLLGRHDEAIRHYREAVRLAPDDAELARRLDAATAAR